MRILHWHVHAAWTTSLVHGPHTVLLPLVEGRGPDGRGRAQTYPWPETAVEVAPDELADAEIDAVVLQRPEEVDLCERWTGRRPGRDLPAVFVEHNSPQGRIAEMRHPLADQDAIPIVHVTHFNALFWDCGAAPTTVIEHGIVDPGERYTGELPRAAVVINEARRRGRVTGTDLLPRLAEAAPLDLFGIDSGSTPWGVEDLPWTDLHAEVARRRVYLHPIRWTSLGLSLLEAMHLGMPVVALGTTEVREAVPEAAGIVSNRIEVLEDALRELVADPDQARERGRAAREAAIARYSIERFTADWEALLGRLVGSGVA
jgi:glycosyltransferase involved in cell wall biosynthesis